MTELYLIGSLRNDRIPILANSLRDYGYEVFDDWMAAGPEADDYWQKYSQGRGQTYGEALQSYAAENVFNFDKRHLDRCDGAVLALPAGKSGHLELGYMAGRGKPTFVHFPDGEPDRWDVMYQFCTGVSFDQVELVENIRNAFG